MNKLIVALIFVALNFYTYRYFATEDTIPDRTEFVNFPMMVDEWRCGGNEVMGEDVINVLGVTDYLFCNWVSEESGQLANFYAGYHASQTRNVGGKENLIHPPEHCLPGSGWDIIDSRIVPIEFGGGGEAKRVVVAKGNQRNLVYFWYQSRGRVLARNHEKVLYMFLDRAVEGRTDGSLIRFTVPIQHGDEEAAEQAFRSLAFAITPLLPDYVPN
jgi:EpsI family protein